MTDPKLIDHGKVTNESDSDYEMSFTEHWWKFQCDCGKVIYKSSSYSVIGKKDKLHCDACGKNYTLTKTYVCGREKKP